MAINSSLTLTIYTDFMDADAAVKTFHKAYFDSRKLSVVRQNYHAEKSTATHYSFGNHISSWGRFGAFCGWIWGMVFGIAFFIIPGVKPIVAGGPIVSWLVCMIGAAAALGGMSALVAALVNLGSMIRNRAGKYKPAMKLLGSDWRNTKSAGNTVRPAYTYG